MSEASPQDSIAAGLEALPGPLRRDLPERWRRFGQAHPAVADAVQADAQFVQSVPRVWAASEFVTEHCLRDGDALAQVADMVRLRWTPGELLAGAATMLQETEDEAAALRILRLFRRREMLRIAWRDLAGWAVLEETLGHLSELAEVCIRAADDWVHRGMVAKHGEPLGRDGTQQRLLVVAMG